MVVVLPVCYVLLLLLARSFHGCWRRAAVEALVIWGLLVALVTETLSLPHWLSAGPIGAGWLSAIVIAGILLKARRRSATDGSPAATPLARSEALMLAAVVGLTLVTGIVAVTAPPNTWDAMEYHLPRTFFWMQNRSVANYATPDYAQLMFAPWAEFAMLQFYALLGSDRLVNLVAFSCYLGAITTTSLIAEQLGASRWEQILAAVVAATLPEAVLEASGAMNTVVVSFWILATVYFTLLLRSHPHYWTVTMAGGSAALAILSKGTAYIYLPPVMLACFCILPRGSRLALAARLPLVAAIIAVVNLGTISRNLELTRSPLGLPFPDGGPRLHWMNDTMSVGSSSANVIRNVTLHLGTPFAAVNAAAEKNSRYLFQLIGQDPDDPSHTWAGGIGFHWPTMTRHEITAGNLLHFLIIVSVLAAFLFRRNLQRDKMLIVYLIGVAGAFLLFCTLLRYQVWASRHHLPLFCLLAAATGLMLPRYSGRRVAGAVAALMIVAAVPFAVDNKLRSLVPGDPSSVLVHSRDDLYFADQHADAIATSDRLVDAVSRSPCRTAGVDAKVGTPDSELVGSVPSFFVYPILAMIHERDPDLHIGYVGVHNLTRRFASASSPRPCIVICLDCSQSAEIPATYRTWAATTIGPDVVLERADVSFR